VHYDAMKRCMMQSRKPDMLSLLHVLNSGTQWKGFESPLSSDNSQWYFQVTLPAFRDIILLGNTLWR